MCDGLFGLFLNLASPCHASSATPRLASSQPRTCPVTEAGAKKYMKCLLDEFFIYGDSNLHRNPRTLVLQTLSEPVLVDMRHTEEVLRRAVFADSEVNSTSVPFYPNNWLSALIE